MSNVTDEGDVGDVADWNVWPGTTRKPQARATTGFAATSSCCAPDVRDYNGGTPPHDDGNGPFQEFLQIVFRKHPLGQADDVKTSLWWIRCTGNCPLNAKCKFRYQLYRIDKDFRVLGFRCDCKFHERKEET